MKLANRQSIEMVFQMVKNEEITADHLGISWIKKQIYDLMINCETIDIFLEKLAELKTNLGLVIKNLLNNKPDTDFDRLYDYLNNCGEERNKNNFTSNFRENSKSLRIVQIIQQAKSKSGAAEELKKEFSPQPEVVNEETMKELRRTTMALYGLVRYTLLQLVPERVKPREKHEKRQDTKKKLAEITSQTNQSCIIDVPEHLRSVPPPRITGFDAHGCALIKEVPREHVPNLGNLVTIDELIRNRERLEKKQNTLKQDLIKAEHIESLYNSNNSIHREKYGSLFDMLQDYKLSSPAAYKANLVTHEELISFIDFWLKNKELLQNSKLFTLLLRLTTSYEENEFDALAQEYIRSKIPD